MGVEFTFNPTPSLPVLYTQMQTRVSCQLTVMLCNFLACRLQHRTILILNFESKRSIKEVETNGLKNSKEKDFRVEYAKKNQIPEGLFHFSKSPDCLQKVSSGPLAFGPRTQNFSYELFLTDQSNRDVGRSS